MMKGYAEITFTPSDFSTQPSQLHVCAWVGDHEYNHDIATSSYRVAEKGAIRWLESVGATDYEISDKRYS